MGKIGGRKTARGAEEFQMGISTGSVLWWIEGEARGGSDGSRGLNDVNSTTV